MGTKRKANQAQLTAEPRRSKRNVDKNDELTDAINEDEPNVATKPTKSAATKKVTSRAGRQTVRGNINTTNERRDLNKEFVPIRTYGKLDKAASPATNLVKKDENSNTKKTIYQVTVKRNVAPTDRVQAIKPEKTIKKKTEEVVQQKKKGNLTINSPARLEIKTTAPGIIRPVQSTATISTVETGGQKKVSIN